MPAVATARIREQRVEIEKLLRQRHSIPIALPRLRELHANAQASLESVENALKLRPRPKSRTRSGSATSS